MSIVKRKKQDKFFIMDNAAVQNHLTSLNAIGLLAYITSLPADWQLYKTNLYNKFSRKTVDSAWKELIEKRYVAGFSAYVDRKKQYFYIASDEQLTQNEYDEFVQETFYEEYEKDKFIPKNLQIIKDNQFEILFDFKAAILHLEKSIKSENIAENVDIPSVVPIVQHLKNDDFSDVRLVQHSEYSTSSTVLNEHIQINNIQSTKEQINNEKETLDVNIDSSKLFDKNSFEYKKLRSYRFDDEDFDSLANVIFENLFYKYNQGIFDKKQWEHVCSQIKFEYKRDKVVTGDLYRYLESTIKTICSRRKQKLGIEKKEVPFYNWLDVR